MAQKSIDPAQEALIVSSERSQHMQVRDFLSNPEDGVAVDIIERDLHLINCLASLAGASMRSGLVTVGEDAILDRYGNRASAVVQGAAREGERQMKQAKWAFAHATGMYAMIDSGLVTENYARALTRGSFTEFKWKFYGARHHQEAHAYSRQLVRNIDQLKLTVSTYNREHNLRPHQAKPLDIPEDATADERRELQTLDTRERLQAILFDPRAGFLTATNTEKNVVLTFLDYLDNPDYPLGINNQLFEVLTHGEKNLRDKHTNELIRRGSFEDGRRAVESITWGLGDFLADAAQSHRLLLELKAAAVDISPKVTLAEEVGADHAAIPVYLRYRSVKEYMEKGRVAGLNRIPVRTAEDRWIPAGAGTDPGKHKTLHGPFTRPDRTPAFEKYIETQAKHITFGELRRDIDDAIGNELQRAAFMLSCLQDVLEIHDSRAMGPIKEAVRVSLEKVKDEPVLQVIAREQTSAAA